MTYTILIVDDDKSIREALVHQLDWDSIGFRIVGEAINGLEAIELLEDLHPDLVLTDIDMPFVNGIELARQIRQIRPMTQIAFMSENEKFEVVRDAVRYNIISYIRKPLFWDDIKMELIRIHEKMQFWREEFKSSQERNINMERNHYLISLLMDEHTPGIFGKYKEYYEDYILNNAVRCGILNKDTYQNKMYAVLVTAIINKENQICTNPGHLKLLTCIFAKYLNSFCVIAQGKIVTLCIGSQKELEKYIPIASKEIAENIESVLVCRSYTGISNLVNKISDIHISYKEAMNAISFAVFNKSDIFYAWDVDALKYSEQVELNREVYENIEKTKDDFCGCALCYINENFADSGLSLDMVSSHIGITPNYLTSLLKKEYGLTFKEHLTKKRMETAKELLCNTNMKIGKIAEKCGYSEQNYFSYSFKKYTGMSPNSFRSSFSAADTYKSIHK